MGAQYGEGRGSDIRKTFRLIATLRNQQLTAKEISRLTGMRLRSTYRWLDAGIDEGLIEKIHFNPFE